MQQWSEGKMAGQHFDYDARVIDKVPEYERIHPF
jgi:hypothetical protein